MSPEISQGRRFTPVKQISIFSENKVGRLNELCGLLAANKVHILALSAIDSTDSSIIRIVVDYHEQALALIEENNFAFCETEVVCVEVDAITELKRITCSLVEAEINIHYIYPFFMRPAGKPALVVRLEDNELASAVLRQHQIKVLSQEDIAR